MAIFFQKETQIENPLFNCIYYSFSAFMVINETTHTKEVAMQPVLDSLKT